MELKVFEIRWSLQLKLNGLLAIKHAIKPN